MWGMAPVFFKLLEEVPAYEIIAHRILWSLVLLALFISLSKGWGPVIKIIKQPAVIFSLLLSSILVCANWTIYVWAVNHGHVLETSLGYFICPLSSIVLAIVFLKERFRPLQWVALALAVLGIAVQLWIFGTLPVIALSIAVTFSLYGFVRKKISVPAAAGLFLETLWLSVPALMYLFFFTQGSLTSNILENPIHLNLLLMACGLMTTIPLILFNVAAIRLKFSTLSLLQYTSPSMVFLLALFVYHESMGMDKWITFGFIWTGLILFIADSRLHVPSKSVLSNEKPPHKP